MPNKTFNNRSLHSLDGCFLFPWAQSVSAVELSDGTKAITSPTAGSWITKVCGGISIVSFISAILVGVFYNPKNNDSSA